MNLRDNCKMQLLVIAVVYTLLLAGECQKERAPAQLSMPAVLVVTLIPIP